jgi:LemA protein
MAEQKMLEAYLEKMMTLQMMPREKPLTEAEMKQTALDLGMSEADWQESRKLFSDSLQRGQGSLAMKNWDAAIKELEQAYGLNPSSIDAAFGLAQAYKGLFLESQHPDHKLKAEDYANRALLVNPSHRPSLNLLSELRQTVKAVEKQQQRQKVVFYGAAAAVVLILFFTFSSIRNSLVEKEQKVEQAWAQVENVYQRRSELVPKLVNTVKASAEVEAKSIEQLSKAYQDAAALAGGKNLNATEFEKFSQKQEQLSQLLNGFIAQGQSKPSLKSSQAFRDLQIQLEGSENRIAVERRRFNQAVQEYNAAVKQFPASLLGFKERAYFKASADAMKSPDVKF